MQKSSTRLWLQITASAGIVLVGISALHGLWTRQLWHLTGDAQWVWMTDSLTKVRQSAGLFVGTVEVAAPPQSALLKICGDREYVVYVNGTAAACGWSRPGFRLDLYDIVHLLRQGRNTIAVEVRSPSPVGGVLFALDIDGVGRNVLVSGPQTFFRDYFSTNPPEIDAKRVPVVWGRPPRFPWSYPVPVARPQTLDQVVVEDPIRVEVAERTVEGESLFYLPRPINGYLWVELEGDGEAQVGTSPVSRGDMLGELRANMKPVVRLKNQQRWLDPEPRLIGSVSVTGQIKPRAIEVWAVGVANSAVPGSVTGKHGLVPRTRWTNHSLQE